MNFSISGRVQFAAKSTLPLTSETIDSSATGGKNEKERREIERRAIRETFLGVDYTQKEAS